MPETRQRKAIFKALQRLGRPLSRDEILHHARAEVLRLGPATVDRTIREATKAYQLIGVDFPGQPRRYELPASDGEHPHFVCRHCGKVFDLPCEMVLPQVQLPDGFVLEGGEVIYSGACPSCSSANTPST